MTSSAQFCFCISWLYLSQPKLKKVTIKFWCNLYLLSFLLKINPFFYRYRILFTFINKHDNETQVLTSEKVISDENIPSLTFFKNREIS